MLMTTYDQKKAVRLNPVYARSTGWLDKYQQIAVLMGFEYMSPGPEAFADAIYAWQAQTPPLKADGILGPNSWKHLEYRTNFTPAGPPAPSWVRYIPPKKVTEEVDVVVPTNIWFALMIDVGGMLAYYGENAMMGTFRSLDDPHKSFDACASRIRLGLGLGGGIGASVVVAFNVKTPADLAGHRSESTDFNLSVGVPFSKVAKSAIKFPRLVKALDKITDLERVGGAAATLIGQTKNIARQASRLDPDEYAALAKFLREQEGAVNAAKSTKVQVVALSLPLPGQVEASVFWQQEDWMLM